MKRNLFSLVCLALLVAGVGFAGELAAQSPTGPTETTTGRVVTTSPGSLVIEADTGGRLTFAVDGQTTMNVTPAVGQTVTVEYHTLSGGNFHAATISSGTPAGTGTESTTGGTGAYGTPGRTGATGATGTTGTTTPSASASASATVEDEEADDEVGDTAAGADERLPDTAGSLPAMALIGALALLGALGLHVARRL